MKSIFLAIALLSANCVLAQMPTLVWQKNYGGTMEDLAFRMCEASDKGYILIGKTKSNDGDIAYNNGNGDDWIVKINDTGLVVWEKNYGGSLEDEAICINPTFGGGYIISGYSRSSDGDVTVNYGDFDGWVLKLDNNGDLSWQKSLGGAGWDETTYVLQTKDSGYIVSGYTQSNTGDFSANHGANDIWIVKLNNVGDVVWQKILGGSSEDRAFSVIQTLDGGYAVSGFTMSNDGDISGNHGGSDVCIIKLDSLGNTTWQKSLGGSGNEMAFQIIQNSDSSYTFAGNASSTDGDVSNNHGGSDMWVVKLDKSGNLIWQNSYGGTLDDGAMPIIATSDGGYIVAGSSESNDGDLTVNQGGSDRWIIKIDGNGNLEWQKSMGGLSVEDALSIVRDASDGGYFVLGNSNSDNTGDVGPGHGDSDFWLTKISSDNPLGLNIISFNASARQGYNQITWHTTNEDDGLVYEVQRSNDSKQFQTIAHLPKNNTSIYQFNDFNSNRGYNYYRLFATSANNPNEGVYSSIACVNNNIDNQIRITTSPNPASNFLHINIENVVEPRTKIIIYNSKSEVVQSVLTQKTDFNIDISLLPSGIYYLKVVNGTHEMKKTISVMK